MKKINLLFLSLAIFYSDVDAFAQVTNSSGVQLIVSGDLKLVFNDFSFVNNGSFTPATSTVIFTGGIAQTISGASPTSFSNISLNKNTSSSISLQRNIDVNGNIIFTTGLLDLNNFNIMLSPTSLLTGETESSRITGTNGGYIQITTDINIPSTLNPGNLGAILSSSKNWGSTVIRRGHAAQTRSAVPNFSINRYYDIIPTNNQTLNAILKFSYFDAELNGKTEAELWLWKSTDYTNWFVSSATDTRDVLANYVTGKNINSFSRWTLSDASFPVGILGPCEGKSELKFWPNPYSDQFNIGVSSTKSSQATMQLFDMSGRLAVSQLISLNTGRNLFSFSFPNLPSGTYIMKIADNDCSITVGKIIKQNR